MPLPYLESLESGMGAQPAPYPTDLRFVLCEGDPHGETFATLVSPSVSSCSFRVQESSQWAQDPKSNTSSSRTASLSESLGSPPWVCATNMFLHLVAKELHF